MNIWLYNLPPVRVDAGSCVVHIYNFENLYSLNMRLTSTLCQFSHGRDHVHVLEIHIVLKL